MKEVMKAWRMFDFMEKLAAVGLFAAGLIFGWAAYTKITAPKKYHAYQFLDGSFAVCAEIDRSGASVSLFDCMNGRVYLCMTNVKRADDLMETK